MARAATPGSLVITLAQMHPVAGDLPGNTAQIDAALAAAQTANADLLVLPGHALWGPVGGLADLPPFSDPAHFALRDLTARAPLPVVLGPTETAYVRAIEHGDIRAALTDGDHAVEAGGVPLAFVDLPQALHHSFMIRVTTLSSVRLIVVPAADRFRIDGPTDRVAAMARLAAETNRPVVFCNAVGGADDKVFSGGSFAVTPTGDLLFTAPLFTPGVHTITVPLTDPSGPKPDPRKAIDNALAAARTFWGDAETQTWSALVTGIRDYVHGNGFTDVVIGLSGGIDSAVVAALATDALGSDHVRGIGMPGRYSSDGSVSDAQMLAANLGIQFTLLLIDHTVDAETETLGGLLDGPGGAIARENLQARVRAVHLFSIANARNALVLNTCNRSEDAVGYATYGGDAMGGFAPLADASKDLVYRLARWRNRQPDGPIIPEATLTKAPSAELAPGQRDTDTLPDYPVLDSIIDAVCDGVRPAQIVDMLVEQHGLDAAEADRQVGWTLTMLGRSEWKRRQAPVGPALTKTPLWTLRLPITNRAPLHTPIAQPVG